MAVKLRLSRKGAKKRPFYYIVATDGRNPRDGRCLERLGYFDPRAETLHVEADKVEAWVARGAQPSETVAKLLKRAAKAAAATPAAPAA